MHQREGLRHAVSARSKRGLCIVAGSDGSFYQVKASSMSLMELVYDALLYPTETK